MDKMGSILKEWLKQNKQVTMITRDRVNVYTKAIQKVLYVLQIADRFHLYQNLLETIHKVIGKELPTTMTIASEASSIEIDTFF